MRTWLFVAAAVLLPCAQAQAPMIVAEGGDVVLTPSPNGRVRVGSEPVATADALSGVRKLTQGLAGTLFGPNVQLSVRVYVPASNANAVFSRDQQATQTGLTTPAWQPYDDVAAFLSSTIQNQVLCFPDVPTATDARLVVTVNTQSSIATFAVNSNSDACRNGPQTLAGLLDSVAIMPPEQFGGALGALFKRVTTTTDTIQANLDDTKETLAQQLAALLQTHDKDIDTVNGNVQTARQDLNGQLADVTKSIQALAADVSSHNATLAANLATQQHEAACRSNGQVWDGTKCVDAVRICAGRPPVNPLAVAQNSASGDCPSASVIANGPACAFTCPQGYVSNSGAASFTCSSSGSWVASVNTLTCTPKSCGAPPSDAKYVWSVKSNVFGGLGATIDCAKGYTHGTELVFTATCQADGTWAHQLTCAPVACPSAVPNLPSNGKASCGGKTFGQTCAATCTGDYTGSATYTCNSDGQWESAAPLACKANAKQGYAQVPDTVTGCPPTRAPGTPLVRKQIDLEVDSVLWITGHIIRHEGGRKDLQLVVDGSVRDNTLTYTGNQEWADAQVFWTGVLAKGKHDVYIMSPDGSRWGCQDGWGDLDVFWMSAEHAKAYQINDGSPGCPDSSKAGERLLASIFTTTAPKALVMSVGHMIRSGSGRVDLRLFLDNQHVDSSLGWTPTGSNSQWHDMHVFSTTEVAAGNHEIYLSSPDDGRWGCNNDWGDLNFLVIEDPSLYKVYSTKDTRGGCPGGWSSSNPLISQTINIPSKASVVLATGHIIGNYDGRMDLYLRLDGTNIDQTLTPNTYNGYQWQDYQVFSVFSNLSPGDHKVELYGSVDSRFGCGPEWGGLEIVVIGA